MKTIALTSTVFALAASSLTAQSQSDIEFLRARADAQERKISQLERDIIKLKAYHVDKPSAHTAQAASAKPSSTSSSSSYTVKKGDILTRIAYRHKTSVAAIKKENGLKSDRLNIGQKLRIPGAASSSSAVASTPVATQKSVAKASAPSKSPSKHTVKSGETFYAIARQHGVSVQSLIAANPSVRPTSLRVGQSLLVDGNAKSKASSQAVPLSRVASSPKPKAKAPSTKEVEYVGGAKASATPARTKEVAKSSPPKPAAEPAIRTITVHQQMTYGQFASKHGASTNQLNALNGLSLSKNTMLAKGSELYVPQF